MKMLIPLELTERQILIYTVMYKRCDFENMCVEITADQIRTSIDCIDLSQKTVQREIQKICDLGYLQVIKKGTKGTTTIYKIIQDVHKMSTKCPLNISNTNYYDTQDVQEMSIKCPSNEPQNGTDNATYNKIKKQYYGTNKPMDIPQDISLEEALRIVEQMKEQKVSKQKAFKEIKKVTPVEEPTEEPTEVDLDESEIGTFKPNF